MDSILRKFISTRQEKGEGYYTHVSQIQPTGRYNITRKDVEEFWKVYCDTLYDNPMMVSGLAERPMDFMPVLNDTDLKVDYDPDIHSLDRKLYKDTHIRTTVMIYQKHLKQTIKDYQKKYGVCFVLEKERPTLDDKERISHGFHLHFINTIMHKVDQDVHLIPRIRKEINDKNLFSDIGLRNSEDAIDKSCTSKFWLMYGSRKKENLQSYRVTKIYDDDCNEISLKEALSDFRLFDIHEDEIKLDESKLEYYLPRILSVHPENRDPSNRDPVALKTDLSLVTKKILKKAKESKRVHDDLPVPEALKKAKELMKLISVSRADVYDDWIDIGWTLFSIGDGTEEALDMWIDFSSKTTKKNYFSEKLCMYEWERMEKRGKTVGSLYFYAKQDSPDEYKKLQKKENDRLFKESLNGGHYDMAKWLHNKYRDEFVCACVEKNVWFRYKNHRWKLDKKGVSLINKIPIELVVEYKSMKKRVCEEMGEEDDDAEHQKQLKTVNKIIANLKSMPFINNIMKCCEMLFYNEAFSEKLDADPYLLHFNNGVLDLREQRFRPGRPSDYLSLTTGYDFVEHTWDDMEVIECEDYLSKVFPDPELKQFFIEYAANLLQGGNNIKTFLNLTGHGDNSKSVLMDLIKLALGRYMKIFPTTLVTGKRTQSSQATPELSGIQGVRYGVLQEPNSKDVINAGVVKELSGNDIIYVRGLYKEPQEVRPMFKLSLITNKLPHIPGDEEAIWNRIRVLPFEACFPKDASTVPETIEEQIKVKRFPRDPYFSEKLPKMRTAIMWIMWENYKRIKREGRMPEPEKVREATSIYKRNNDVFLLFINERIVEEHNNAKAVMSVVETYNAFKTWFNDSYPNLHSQIPSKEDMKEALSKKWGELNKASKWKGYRLRTAEDDEKDGTAIIIREEDLAQPSDDKDEKEEDEKVDRLLKKKVVSKKDKKDRKKKVVVESDNEDDDESEEDIETEESEEDDSDDEDTTKSKAPL